MGQRYNRGVPESRQVVVYSRKGCHLCEVVKESLAKLSRRGGFTWQEVDVDSDTELRRQFNDEVPVCSSTGARLSSTAWTKGNFCASWRARPPSKLLSVSFLLCSLVIEINSYRMTGPPPSSAQAEIVRRSQPIGYLVGCSRAG